MFGTELSRPFGAKFVGCFSNTKGYYPLLFITHLWCCIFAHMENQAPTERDNKHRVQPCEKRDKNYQHSPKGLGTLTILQPPASLAPPGVIKIIPLRGIESNIQSSWL